MVNTAAFFGQGLARGARAVRDERRRDEELRIARERLGLESELGRARLGLAQEDLKLRQRGEQRLNEKLGFDVKQAKVKLLQESTAELEAFIDEAAKGGPEAVQEFVQSEGFRQTMLGLVERGAQVGFDPTKRIRAKLASIPRPEAVGRAEGEQEVASAQARSDAVGGTPEERRANFQVALGLNQVEGDRFFRILSEIPNAQGERRESLQAMLDSMIKGSGISVTVGPDGSVSFNQGPNAGQPSGTAPLLTAGRLTDEKAQLDSLNESISLVDTTLNALEQDPSAFGVFGSIRRGAQNVVGVSADLGSLIEESLGIDVNEYATRVALAFGGTGELDEFFDPQVPKNQLIENTLALQLAKLRVTKGKGGIRAVSQAFKQAKEDVRLTGLTSSQDVKIRLEEIRALFEKERDALDARVFGREGGSAAGGRKRFRVEGGKLVPAD